jgi:hypothetical protein
MPLDQFLEATLQARIVHRQNGADDGAASDALAVKRLGDLSRGIGAAAGITGESDNQHVRTS